MFVFLYLDMTGDSINNVHRYRKIWTSCVLHGLFWENDTMKSTSLLMHYFAIDLFAKSSFQLIWWRPPNVVAIKVPTDVPTTLLPGNIITALGLRMTMTVVH